MANQDDTGISVEVMREFKRKVVGDFKQTTPLLRLDQLVLVAAVATNEDPMVVQRESERSKSGENSSSSAIQSLRKLNAMKLIYKRRDENYDNLSDLCPELKKRKMDNLDSENEKSKKFLDFKDDDHGDLGTKRKMVTFNSKKDDVALATDTESLRNNDDEDLDFESKKRKNKGKGLMMNSEEKKMKYYSPPSTCHHQDLPEEITRKKDLALEKKLFNSKDDDHSDLGKKRTMVSFNCKKENSSSTIKSRRNNGVQIREFHSRSYREDDQEWDFESNKRDNKGKGLMMYREKKKKKKNDSVPSTTHQDLPEEFKRKIETMGGTSDKVKLVLLKKLYASDLDPQQNRFSLPVNQLLCNFLEAEEVERLEKREVMNISLIDPMVEEEAICLKQWNYWSNSKSYVLITQWSDVAVKNRLKENDLIQVWSFRDCDNNLHLVLVKRGEDSNGAGCSRSSSSRNVATTVGGGESSRGGDHAREDGIYNSGGTSWGKQKQSEH